MIEIAYSDHRGPSCIFQQRPKRQLHAKRKLSQDEENWLNLKPKFETVSEGWVQPFGACTPWDGVQFASRHTELSWLIQTQRQELAALPDEFRANGLPAISLSSSPTGSGDDDPIDISDEDVNRDACRYGTAYTTTDLAPMARHIEWERYILSCSQSTRIYAKTTETGRTLACTDRRWTKDQLADYAKHFREVMGELPPQNEIEAARDRAAHYGQLVWSLMTPAQQDAWRRRAFEVQMYLDFADDNRSRELATDIEPGDGGPQELGLHEPENPLEPTEFDLWPLTEEEQLFGLVPFDRYLEQQSASAA